MKKITGVIFFVCILFVQCAPPAADTHPMEGKKWTMTWNTGVSLTLETYYVFSNGIGAFYTENDNELGDGFTYVIAEDGESVALSGAVNEGLLDDGFTLGFYNEMMFFNPDPGSPIDPAQAKYAFLQIN